MVNLNDVEKTLRIRLGEGGSHIRGYGASKPEGPGYSRKTYEQYWVSCRKIFNWLNKRHPEVDSFEDMAPYLKEYFDATQPLYTLSTRKRERAAVSKLYDVPGKSIYTFGPEETGKEKNTPASDRFREEKEFSKRLKTFVCGTGLRRNELLELEGGCARNGKIYCKNRAVPILPEFREEVERIASEEGRLFPAVDPYAPVLKWRGEYVRALYDLAARDTRSLDCEDLFICRSRKRGKVYDRTALETVRRAAGVGSLSALVYRYLDRSEEFVNPDADIKICDNTK